MKKPFRSQNKDNIYTTKYIDSDSYIIRFRITTVPPSVIYMGKRLHLVPFVEKVRRCQKCQRFGHVARICRTSDKNAVCQRCGKLVSSHSCNNNVNEACTAEKPSCINCVRHKLPDSAAEHEASSNSCPIFQKQRKLKKIMAYHNVSYSEASSMLESNNYQQPSESHTSLFPPYRVPLPTLEEYIPYALPKSYADAVVRDRNSNFSSIPTVKERGFPISDPQNTINNRLKAMP